MIFLSDEDLDVARLVQRWLSTFPEERRMSMNSWIDELFCGQSTSWRAL
jgi:hypothetical protein